MSFGIEQHFDDEVTDAGVYVFISFPVQKSISPFQMQFSLSKIARARSIIALPPLRMCFSQSEIAGPLSICAFHIQKSGCPFQNAHFLSKIAGPHSKIEFPFQNLQIALQMCLFRLEELLFTLVRSLLPLGRLLLLFAKSLLPIGRSLFTLGWRKPCLSRAAHAFY